MRLVSLCESGPVPGDDFTRVVTREERVSDSGLAENRVTRRGSKPGTLLICQLATSKRKELDLLDASCDDLVACGVPAQTHNKGSSATAMGDGGPVLTWLEFFRNVKDRDIVVVRHVTGSEVLAVGAERDMLYALYERRLSHVNIVASLCVPNAKSRLGSDLSRCRHFSFRTKCEAVNVITVRPEELLLVRSFVHHNADTSTVVDQLAFVVVSQVVANVVTTDAVDVVEIELGFWRVTVRATGLVTVGHRMVQNTAWSSSGLIASADLFLIKHVSLLDLALYGRVLESVRVALLLKVTVNIRHTLVAGPEVSSHIFVLGQSVAH